MPYHVIKRGTEYCVAKSGKNNPIKGGCHPSRAKAVSHMKALYVHVVDARKKK